MKKRSVLITDLDNTLYNFVDYFSPCFRAMVCALSRSTKINEEELTSAFREVYKARGSVEYSFAVQELVFFRDLPKAEVEFLIRVAKDAFSQAREEKLKLYPGVIEGLEWAQKSGIPIIGFSNAPIFHALRRLSQLRISKLIYGLAAWEGHEVPGGYEITDAIKKRAAEGGYHTDVKKLWKLTADELKPSSLGYRRVLQDTSAWSDAVFVIGDSLQKDIAPAMTAGGIGLWAKYGAEVEEENMKTLLDITYWSSAQISADYDIQEVTPHGILRSFADIKDIIPPNTHHFL